MIALGIPNSNTCSISSKNNKFTQYLMSLMNKNTKRGVCGFFGVGKEVELGNVIS